MRSDLGATAIAKDFTATFTFRGTAVTWRTIAGPDQGRAQVLIDGVNKGVVDDYKSTLGTRSVAFGGLADAVHTMKIVVLGTKAATSPGRSWRSTAGRSTDEREPRWVVRPVVDGPPVAALPKRPFA